MKKLLALMMALLLCLTASACGNSKKPVDAEQGGTEVTEDDFWFDDIEGNSTVDTTSQQTTSSSNQQDVMNNQTGWSYDNSKYTPEQLDTPYSLRENIEGKVKAFTPFADADVTKKAKEMFEKAYPDAELEIIPTTFAARNQKLQALINSGDIPDYVYGATLEYPFRAIKNLTMPIDEYIHEHPAQDNYLMDNLTSYKGKRYCVVIQEVGEVLWYNTALFASKGEKTPKDYFNEDNWTWDTFASVAKKMTDTQNGVYGFTTDSDSIFALSVGQDVVAFKNGKATLNIKNNAKYMQAYQFFLDMILVQKSARPAHWNSYVEFSKGNAAMYYGSTAHHRQFDAANMKTYDFVPFPKRDKNSSYYCGAASLNEGFGIGKGAKNIEGGMAFGEMMVNAQLELTGNFTNPQFRKVYETFQEHDVKTTFSYAEGLGLYDLYFQQFMGDARKGEKDLNTLINEYAPKFDAKLKDLYR